MSFSFPSVLFSSSLIVPQKLPFVYLNNNLSYYWRLCTIKDYVTWSKISSKWEVSILPTLSIASSLFFLSFFLFLLSLLSFVSLIVKRDWTNQQVAQATSQGKEDGRRCTFRRDGARFPHCSRHLLLITWSSHGELRYVNGNIFLFISFIYIITFANVIE